MSNPIALQKSLLCFIIRTSTYKCEQLYKYNRHVGLLMVNALSTCVGVIYISMCCNNKINL